MLRSDSRGTVAVLLALVTLAGGLLRAVSVSAQSLWLDELITASLLREGFIEMLRAVPGSERTPFLWYALAWPVTRIAGEGELGLRALSVAAGALTIPVAYLAARELASRRVGLVTAALVAVNPLLVWYAQEARAYALLALLSTAALWLCARALRLGDAGWTLAGWAAASSLAIATHYFALLAVVPQAVLLVWRADLRRRALAWACLPLAVLAVHAPLLGEQAGRTSSAISEASSAVRLAGALKAGVVGFSMPHELVITISGAVVAGALVVSALRFSAGEERHGGLIAGGLAVVSFGATVLAALGGRDYLLARNLIIAIVPLLVLLAVGITASRMGRVLAFALVALSLVGALAPMLDARYGRTDWRGAAKALADPASPRAIVVTPAMTPGQWVPYLPGLAELQEGDAVVDEIVVVGLASEGGFTEGAVEPPSAEARRAPKGFDLAEVERSPTYTLVRYRATEPTPVPFGELAELRLDRGTFRVLVQAPARA